MKSTIFFTALAVLAFLLLAKPQISFSPFNVKFESLRYAFGWLMIIVGVSTISYDSEKKGGQRAIQEVSKAIQQLNIKNENDQEQQDTGVQKSQ